MKKLSRFLCVIFTLFISLSLVSCSDPTPPETPKPKPQASTTVETLKSVYNILTYKLEGDEGTTEDTFATGEGEFYYNSFVSAGLSALSEISNIKDIKDYVLYSGEAVDVDLEATGFSSNYANKVEALYITNITNGTYTKLKVTILGSRTTYSENKYNAILFTYDIGYDSSSSKVKEFDMNIVKSTSNIENGFVGTFYSFKYDPNNFLETVLAHKFTLSRHFDITDEVNLSNNIVQNISHNFNSIWYYLMTGHREEVPTSLTNESVQNTVKIVMEKINAEYTEIFKLLGDKVPGASSGTDSGNGTGSSGSGSGSGDSSTGSGSSGSGSSGSGSSVGTGSGSGSGDAGSGSGTGTGSGDASSSSGSNGSGSEGSEGSGTGSSDSDEDAIVIPDTLIYILNAENISDFESKLAVAVAMED